jgi:peptidoglycan/LPS O-acetylase OafA/YrhL
MAGRASGWVWSGWKNIFDEPISFFMTKDNGWTLDAGRNDTSLALDALRSVAAQMVCVGHAYNLFSKTSKIFIPYVGVLLFFLLSGFVIGNTLHQKSSQNSRYGWGEFCCERTARIYSAYLPALLLIAVLDVTMVALGHPLNPVDLRWGIFWRNLFMLQGYQGFSFLAGPTFGSAGQLTSVAVEFHIYLFVGALFFLILDRSPWMSLALALAFSATPLGYFSQTKGEDHALFLLWLMGFCFFFVCRVIPFSRVRLNAVLFLGGVTGVIWWLKRQPGNEYTMDHFPLLLFAFASLVVGTQRSSALANRPWCHFLIRTFSAYSFSLFLIHFTLEKIVLKFWTGSTGGGMATAILFSNLAAFVFATLTERHYKRVAFLLKSIFLPSSFSPVLTSNGSRSGAVA